MAQSGTHHERGHMNSHNVDSFPSLDKKDRTALHQEVLGALLSLSLTMSSEDVLIGACDFGEERVDSHGQHEVQ